MSETARWEDVRVNDSILVESHEGDVTLSGTVAHVNELRHDLYLSDGREVSQVTWSLVDIVKFEPRLPTAFGSVICTDSGWRYVRLRTRDMAYPWTWVGDEPCEPPAHGPSDSFVRSGGFRVLFDAGIDPNV